MDVDPNIAQDRRNIADALATHGRADGKDGQVSHHRKSVNPHERWSKLPKARGRQPRDPNGQAVKFQCRETDDMENELRGYLSAPTSPPEHTTIEFTFPMSSAFMVYAADFKNAASQNTHSEKQYGKLDRTAISLIDALAPNQDAKDRMRRQKAIAKVCVEACEQADGFRYSFHNNWLSREDEACRFSYFCNDSTLNKGRAANEGAGVLGKKMRKPVFDCQGLIAIKFSATKQNLEVHYKHVPLHKTWAERAPPPRMGTRKKATTAITDPEAPLVNLKRRKLTSSEVSDPTNPNRPQTTSAVANHADVGTVNLTREDGLQPLVEFLDNTDTINNNGQSSRIDKHGIPHHQISLPPAGPQVSSGHSFVEIRPRLPKHPSVPGAVVGSVNKDLLQRKSKTAPKSHSKSSNVSQNPLTETVVVPSVISEAASASSTTTANIALTELFALKKKLEEAEARIQRLESEKANAIQPPPPPLMPPQYTIWPPPPGYGPSPQSQYTYSTQTQPFHSRPPQPPPQDNHIRQHEPPQQPFSLGTDDSTAPSESGIHTSRPATEADSVSPRSQKSARKVKNSTSTTGLIGSKFVLYTPKAKKGSGLQRQSAMATSN